MTEAQIGRVKALEEKFRLESFTMYHDIPKGSEVVLGFSKRSDKVAWVEIVEPDPTLRYCYDTGEAV